MPYLRLRLVHGPVTLAPRQTRAIGFRFEKDAAISSQLSFTVTYLVDDDIKIHRAPQVTITVPQKTFTELQKLTFLLPSGVVSYAMIRPPPRDIYDNNDRKCLPVLIGLHGAGDKADGELVRHMLDGAGDIRAWTILPSGVTAWSGDDWRKCSCCIFGL